MVVVAVVGSSLEVHQVRELVLLVSVNELIRMFNFNIQLKLIRKVYMDQIDPYGIQILKFVKIV